VTSFAVYSKLFPVKAHSPAQFNLLEKILHFHNEAKCFDTLIGHDQVMHTEIYIYIYIYIYTYLLKRIYVVTTVFIFVFR
jgi:hypothetical protein